MNCSENLSFSCSRGQGRPTVRASLTRNAASNWIALGVNVAVAYILTPVVIAHVGHTGYGIWILVGSIVGYCGLLHLGVSSGVMCYVARSAGRSDYRATNETVSSALGMFCTMSFVVAAVSFFLSEPLAHVFEVPAEDTETFVNVVRLLGAAVAVELVSSLFQVIMRAHERFLAANCAVIAVNVLRAGSVMSLLYLGWGLEGVAWSQLFAAGAALCLNGMMCRLFVPQVCFLLSLMSRHAARRLCVYGSITTVIAVLDLLRLQAPSVIIGKGIGLSAVGVYGIAALLVQYMVRVVVSAMGVMTPRFAALDASGERETLKRLFLHCLLISGAITFWLAAVLITFGGRFIAMWVGHGFLEAGPALVVLTIGHSFAVCQNIGIGTMYALSKHHWYAVASCIETVLGIMLSIALVFDYGIVGAAIGMCVPMVLVRGLAQPVYMCRLLELRLSQYYAQFLPGLLIGLSVVPVVSWVCESCFCVDRVAYVGGEIAAAGIVAALVLWPVLGRARQAWAVPTASRIGA